MNIGTKNAALEKEFQGTTHGRACHGVVSEKGIMDKLTLFGNHFNSSTLNDLDNNNHPQRYPHNENESLLQHLSRITPEDEKPRKRISIPRLKGTEVEQKKHLNLLYSLANLDRSPYPIPTDTNTNSTNAYLFYPGEKITPEKFYHKYHPRNFKWYHTAAIFIVSMFFGLLLSALWEGEPTATNSNFHTIQKKQIVSQTTSLKLAAPQPHPTKKSHIKTSPLPAKGQPDIPEPTARVATTAHRQDKVKQPHRRRRLKHRNKRLRARASNHPHKLKRRTRKVIKKWLVHARRALKKNKYKRARNYALRILRIHPRNRRATKILRVIQNKRIAQKNYLQSRPSFKIASSMQ